VDVFFLKHGVDLKPNYTRKPTLCVASFGMNFRIKQWTSGKEVKFILYMRSGSNDVDYNILTTC